MTHTIANTADFISCISSGYGHKKVTILIDGEVFSYLTSDMRTVDMLQDDDDAIIYQGKCELIDAGLRLACRQKNNNFKYFI